MNELTIACPEFHLARLNEVLDRLSSVLTQSVAATYDPSYINKVTTSAMAPLIDCLTEYRNIAFSSDHLYAVMDSLRSCLETVKQLPADSLSLDSVSDWPSEEMNTKLDEVIDDVEKIGVDCKKVKSKPALNIVQFFEKAIATVTIVVELFTHFDGNRQDDIRSAKEIAVQQQLVESIDRHASALSGTITSDEAAIEISAEEVTLQINDTEISIEGLNFTLDEDCLSQLIDQDFNHLAEIFAELNNSLIHSVPELNEIDAGEQTGN